MSYKTHGDSTTRFYYIWVAASNRCKNSRNKDFHKYGGRGIKMQWSKYEDFKKDMHRSYLAHIRKSGIKNTTLDRIDVNGNYCKANCRWATVREQLRNTRVNRFVVLNGKKITMAELSEKSGISVQALAYRFSKGLTISRAISLPVRHSNKYATTL